MAAAEKTTEERLAFLETGLAAVLHVAVVGAGASLGDEFPKALRQVAELPDLPDAVRTVLRAIATSAEGGGSSGDVHS